MQPTVASTMCGCSRHAAPPIGNEHRENHQILSVGPVAVVERLVAAGGYAAAAAIHLFRLRAQLIAVHRVLAIGAMSAAILLAARPQWLEPHLHGLDKMYPAA